MNHSWEKIKLSKVLSLYREEIWVDDTKEYSQVTNSKHPGIVLRGKKMGSDIGRKRQFVVNLDKYPNTITFTRQTIQVDEAIGLCPPEVNGCIVTENMPLFAVENCEPKFVELFFKTNQFLSQLRKTAALGTSQQSIHEDIFLNYEITFPPLIEQQRIVGKIGYVMNCVEQLSKLRAEQEKEINSLRNSIIIDLRKEYGNIPIGEVVLPNNQNVQINSDNFYKQVTVRMEHKGVLLRGLIKGSEIGSKQLLANENNFIISKIDARNGAMGMIPAELEGAIVTNDFPLFKFSEDIIPKYFYYFSDTYYFDDACKKASEGTTNRKRLKMEKFRNIQIPLPPIEEQKRIVVLLDKLNGIKTNHNKIANEIKNIVPTLLNKAFDGDI
jgi:restriction endonuclease S subunit